MLSLCFPVRLSDRDIKTFDRIVRHRKPVTRGTHLFRSGDRFSSIYVVRSGAVKTIMHTADGQEYVSGLHLAGAVIGLDAIDYDSHPNSAVALDTTAVCEIPFDRLEALGAAIPDLQQVLVKLISRELLGEQEMTLAIAKRTAEQRVAIALVDLAERSADDRRPALRFRLPASRRDLSNYLGLAPETTSRLFRRLEERRLIAVDEHDIVLRDVAGLYRLAQRSLPEQRFSACYQRA